MKVIEKLVTGWRKKDKHPCPECGKKLSSPNYYCDKCDVKLKLKMNFDF